MTTGSPRPRITSSAACSSELSSRERSWPPRQAERRSAAPIGVQLEKRRDMIELSGAVVEAHVHEHGPARTRQAVDIHDVAVPDRCSALMGRLCSDAGSLPEPKIAGKGAAPVGAGEIGHNLITLSGAASFDRRTRAVTGPGGRRRDALRRGARVFRSGAARTPPEESGADPDPEAPRSESIHVGDRTAIEAWLHPPDGRGPASPAGRTGSPTA